MKKMIMTILAMAAMTAFAMAADRATSSITTNSTSAAIPLGETGSFAPAWMLVAGIPAGSTQTVQYVASGVTGAVATTADAAISLTNLPPMFPDDLFIVTPSVTLTTNDDLRVSVIGEVVR